MKRGKDYIIFPLDLSSREDVTRYVELLSGHVGMFKVGLELFLKFGPDMVRYIKDNSDAEIFLDLKFHDIPVTVARAVESIAGLGVTFTTVHCGESGEMLKAAVAAGGDRVGILGVTVLTSVSGADIASAGFRDEYSEEVARLIEKRALGAREAGCRGVVCSGLEAGMIKSLAGEDFYAVTPGIRPAWDGVEKGDQKRVTTPAQAIQNGSDYLVIGRPIRDAADPREAARRIAEEIDGALGA